MSQQTVSIWDPLVRTFHWVLVGSFVLAWWLEDDFLSLHLLAGSVVFGLLVFRFIWGFIGTPYSVFKDLLLSPYQLISHLQSLLRGRVQHYPGHTPAGSAMILLLLGSLLLLVSSGVLVYTMQTGAGLMSGWVEDFDYDTELLLTRWHGYLADGIVVLVMLHIGGVLLESFLQKQNLTLAMITGRKKCQEVEK